jgi:Nucleotide modification associated domain 1
MMNINYEHVVENEFEEAIVDTCHELAEIIIRKNRDYGDSFRKVYEEYGDLSLIIRLTDKLERLKSLQNKENLVKDESKEDTIRDTAGYAILALALKKVIG